MKYNLSNVYQKVRKAIVPALATTFLTGAAQAKPVYVDKKTAITPDQKLAITAVFSPAIPKSGQKARAISEITALTELGNPVTADKTQITQMSATSYLTSIAASGTTYVSEVEKRIPTIPGKGGKKNYAPVFLAKLIAPMPKASSTTVNEAPVVLSACDAKFPKTVTSANQAEYVTTFTYPIRLPKPASSATTFSDSKSKAAAKPTKPAKVSARSSEFRLEDEFNLGYGYSSTFSEILRSDNVLAESEATTKGIDFGGYVRPSLRVYRNLRGIANAEFGIAPSQSDNTDGVKTKSDMSIWSAALGAGYPIGKGSIWALGGMNSQTIDQLTMSGPLVVVGYDLTEGSRDRIQLEVSGRSGELKVEGSEPISLDERTIALSAHKDFKKAGATVRVQNDSGDDYNINTVSAGLEYRLHGYGANVQGSYSNGTGILGSKVNGYGVRLGVTARNGLAKAYNGIAKAYNAIFGSKKK